MKKKRFALIATRQHQTIIFLIENNWCIHAAQGLRGVGEDAGLAIFLKL